MSVGAIQKFAKMQTAVNGSSTVVNNQLSDFQALVGGSGLLKQHYRQLDQSIESTTPNAFLSKYRSVVAGANGSTVTFGDGGGQLQTSFEKWLLAKDADAAETSAQAIKRAAGVTTFKNAAGDGFESALWQNDTFVRAVGRQIGITDGSFTAENYKARNLK